MFIAPHQPNMALRRSAMLLWMMAINILLLRSKTYSYRNEIVGSTFVARRPGR